jgi:hypothetical protein
VVGGVALNTNQGGKAHLLVILIIGNLLTITLEERKLVFLENQLLQHFI